MFVKSEDLYAIFLDIYLPAYLIPDGSAGTTCRACVTLTFDLTLGVPELMFKMVHPLMMEKDCEN